MRWSSIKRLFRSGWLLKLSSGKKKKYEKRYAILREGAMFYYKNKPKTESEPSNKCIPLEVTRDTPDMKRITQLQDPHCFFCIIINFMDFRDMYPWLRAASR